MKLQDKLKNDLKIYEISLKNKIDQNIELQYEKEKENILKNMRKIKKPYSAQVKYKLFFIINLYKGF